jgi:hypothetical protein
MQYVDDFAEMAKHFYAIIPDGYYDGRELNPFLSDVLITGLALPQAAAIARHFKHAHIEWSQSTHPDTSDASDLMIHLIPSEAAEAFFLGLGGWLAERGLL